MIMPEKIKDTMNPRTDHLKSQTAEALEEAARKLRNVNVSEKTDEVKKILLDVETRMNHFREEAVSSWRKSKPKFTKKSSPLKTS